MKILKANVVMPELQLIRPAWPLPDGVSAVISTRLGGFSGGVYAGANLGDHVGDVPERVALNRQQLVRQTGIQQWPWLQQEHGVEILEADRATGVGLAADGVITAEIEMACAILTADCLPILICASDGSQIAAVHAGWRGLAAGIIARSVARFACGPARLSAYLGPAISQNHFEVGEDVLDAFKPWSITSSLWQQFFIPQIKNPGHYRADLFGLARWSLHQLGVSNVYGGDLCTFSDPQRFYSYRRDGVTGRMVSAIWRNRM